MQLFLHTLTFAHWRKFINFRDVFSNNVVRKYSHNFEIFVTIHGHAHFGIVQIIVHRITIGFLTPINLTQSMHRNEFLFNLHFF